MKKTIKYFLVSLLLAACFFLSPVVFSLIGEWLVRLLTLAFVLLTYYMVFMGGKVALKTACRTIVKLGN